MPWYIVLFLAWLALAAIVAVMTVGKQRKPTEPHQVAIALVLLGLQAWALVAVSR